MKAKQILETRFSPFDIVKDVTLLLSCFIKRKISKAVQRRKHKAKRCKQHWKHSFALKTAMTCTEIKGPFVGDDMNSFQNESHPVIMWIALKKKWSLQHVFILFILIPSNPQHRYPKLFESIRQNRQCATTSLKHVVSNIFLKDRNFPSQNFITRTNLIDYHLYRPHFFWSDCFIVFSCF